MLGHADEETFPLTIVGLSGALSSTTFAQDTPTFNLFFPQWLAFSAVLVHSLGGAVLSKRVMLQLCMVILGFTFVTIVVDKNLKWFFL